MPGGHIYRVSAPGVNFSPPGSLLVRSGLLTYLDVLVEGAGGLSGCCGPLANSSIVLVLFYRHHLPANLRLCLGEVAFDRAGLLTVYFLRVNSWVIN